LERGGNCESRGGKKGGRLGVGLLTFQSKNTALITKGTKSNQNLVGVLDVIEEASNFQKSRGEGSKGGGKKKGGVEKRGKRGEGPPPAGKIGHLSGV